MNFDDKPSVNFSDSGVILSHWDIIWLRCKWNSLENSEESIATFISILANELKLFKLKEPIVVQLLSITAAFPCKMEFSHS